MDAALIVGMTVRLTRLVTTDDLGGWLIRDPAFSYADRALTDDGAREWAVKLLNGLYCPWCVGYWIGLFVILSYTVARTSRPLLALWRIVASSLSLNLVTGSVPIYDTESA